MQKESNDSNQVKTMLERIDQKLDKIAAHTEHAEIAEYVHMMKHPRKIIFKNILAGIARGVGFAIGFTVFLVTLLYLLRALGALNIPIIGDYIADIVEIVQGQLELRGRYGY